MIIPIAFLLAGAMTGHLHDTIPGKLYANLHVGNRAGKKVTLVWSEEDSPKTRDMADGETIDIIKTFSADKSKDGKMPSYDFQVREFDTGNNLMINGQKTYTVKTSDDPNNVEFIEIAPGGKFNNETFQSI